MDIILGKVICLVVDLVNTYISLSSWGLAVAGPLFL